MPSISRQAGAHDIRDHFQVIHPAEHSELHSRLKEDQDRGTIEGALDQLSEALQHTAIEGVDLSGRPKNLYGVMKKMHDKKKAVDQVYDVRALRIIVQSKSDCYAVLREVRFLLLFLIIAVLFPSIDGSPSRGIISSILRFLYPSSCITSLVWKICSVF